MLTTDTFQITPEILSLIASIDEFKDAWRALDTLAPVYREPHQAIASDKEVYYPAPRQTQATIRNETPDWQPWLVFFLRSLTEQVARLFKPWLPLAAGGCQQSASTEVELHIALKSITYKG